MAEYTERETLARRVLDLAPKQEFARDAETLVEAANALASALRGSAPPTRQLCFTSTAPTEMASETQWPAIPLKDKLLYTLRVVLWFLGIALLAIVDRRVGFGVLFMIWSEQIRLAMKLRRP